jgi:riboflavin biosynthesis pyrimidine reductase
MEIQVFQLYPPPHQEHALNGLYLKHCVNDLGTSESPFVYANFVSSLDGRIALKETGNGRSYLPEGLTTPSDFRLFLELLTQADCLITHGGYFRALAEDRLGNILQIGLTPETDDLSAWRANHGLTQQPAVVVASASLDFPVPESIKQHNQTIHIATGRAADRQRVQYWETKGYKIIYAGKGKQVEGAALVRALAGLGYKSLYLVAGPRMLDSMLRERQLSRLYLTITHQLMGGESFHSLLPGPVLGTVGHLQLLSLYYDSNYPAGAGQWFAQFETSSYETPS